MQRNLWLMIITTCFMLLTACNGNSESVKELDYDATKKMIVDILQTEDGKKALSEVLNDDSMKQQLIIDSDAIRDTLRNILLAEEGKEVWTKYFNDPSFVESFAKSLEKEHINMLKRAMNDPVFQKQMIETFQDPALSEHYLTILKSQAFREHLETLIDQSLNTPNFQGKLQQMIDDQSNDASQANEQEEKQQQEEEADQ